MLSELFAIVAKDIRIEFRSRVAISTILLFGVSTVTLISFSLGAADIPPATSAALYWVVIFFSAVTGLSHVFVREHETGTLMALKTAAEAVPVFLGKLLVNFLLLTLLMILLTPLFFIFLQVDGGNLLLFALLILLGDLALCAGMTLVAAIIARAASRGALFAVLSFPILIPLLLVLVTATNKLFDGGGWEDISTPLQFLFSYCVVMGIGSVMLFPFVWDE